MEKTTELFDLWNKEKVLLDNTNSLTLKVKKRQFWLCKIWVNIWSEISKEAPFIRPVLVLNDRYRGDLILVLPLTTKINKKFSEFYIKIDGEKYWLDRDSYILLNQLKVISKKRLVRKLNDKKDENNNPIHLLDNVKFMEIITKIKENI